MSDVLLSDVQLRYEAAESNLAMYESGESTSQFFGAMTTIFFVASFILDVSFIPPAGIIVLRILLGAAAIFAFAYMARCESGSRVAEKEMKKLKKDNPGTRLPYWTIDSSL